MIRVLLFIGLICLPVQELGFSGVWERDVERSDDPREKMQAAMQQMPPDQRARLVEGMTALLATRPLRNPEKP